MNPLQSFLAVAPVVAKPAFASASGSGARLSRPSSRRAGVSACLIHTSNVYYTREQDGFLAEKLIYKTVRPSSKSKQM